MDRFLELYWKRINSSSFIRCLFILCTLAIIWLCLVPRPDEFLPPLPFPHFDKVVHACMFGGWAFLGMLAGWLPYSNVLDAGAGSGRWLPPVPMVLPSRSSNRISIVVLNGLTLPPTRLAPFWRWQPSKLSGPSLKKEIENLKR
jgi:hypothetical protein